MSWLPNALTLLRIAAAPLVGWLIWRAPEQASNMESGRLYLIAFGLFSVACLTDWLDGYLARALNATSEFGAKLDLWADKIIVAAVLFGMIGHSLIWAVAGLLCLSVRDLYIMRLRQRRPDVNLKASFLAKSKTAIVMAGIATTMLGTALIEFSPANNAPIQYQMLASAGVLAFVVGCLLSLYTGWQYVAAANQSAPAE
ncbi:MAG: CDP-alcohol phosphatidyltransferase family protein [Pseudomonadota bacterium]